MKFMCKYFKQMNSLKWASYITAIKNDVLYFNFKYTQVHSMESNYKTQLTPMENQKNYLICFGWSPDGLN